MATIEIYAKACKFHAHGMSYNLLGAKLASEVIETTKCADIEAAREAMRDKLKALDARQSFFVTSMVKEGRSPSGYKKMPHYLPHDAGPDAKTDEPEPKIDGARYQVVGLDEVLNLTPDNLIPALDIRNHPQLGYSKSTALRKELQGRPTFKGLCGPMWGGETPGGLPIIRYETAEANEIYSR